jgi:hypothetical protein
MTDYKHRRSRGGRIGTALVAVAVIVVVIAALVLYDGSPTSNTVYCGVLQYVVFPALAVTKGSTVNVTQTMTTTVVYTTTTTRGQIGHTYSNSTTTTTTSGYSAGVETICKYISNISTSSSK